MRGHGDDATGLLLTALDLRLRTLLVAHLAYRKAHQDGGR